MFRLQAKKAFLTYAGIGHEDREGYTKEELFAFLNQKFVDSTQIIVGWEAHKDGTPHAHAYIEWADKQDMRNAREVFKYKNHVPNIQAVRSPRQVIKYVTKDGDYMCKEDIEPETPPDHVTIVKAIEDGATPEDAAVAAVASSNGKNIRYFTQMLVYARTIKKESKVCEPLRNFPDDFKINDQHRRYLDEFVALFATRDIRNRDGMSLWFYGPSRVGKTQLARSLGRHWYMQGMWNLDQYTDDAEYGVIDDFDWDQFSKYGYKPLLGLQYQPTVTDKYRGKRMITHGKPVIMITNELPEFKNGEGAWLNANVIFLEFYDKVFE